MVKSVPLKAVLRNFLNHFETLESRHKLSIDSNDLSIDLYRKEFQTLKELTETLKTDPNCASDEGENDVNRRKNRYKDILPYDHSRVILSEYPGVPGSDYMNANYVKGSSGCARAYIASQGPLPNTVVDFWRMIWEADVTVIVMACNEMESGKYKCESYWPEDNVEPQQYGNITVELSKCRQVCPDFLVRTLKVRADSTERVVCQFHYQTWPDHGVPNSVHPILELVRLMRDVQISETRPILVHCSAGCGRTGTICSIDYVWALLRTGKLKEDFSLYTIIKDMRRQRIAMVQTLEQYMLCYKAVATLFEQQLKMIDSHTYENIDGDGEPIMRRQLLDPKVTNEKTNQIGDQIIHKKEKNTLEPMSSLPISPFPEEVRHERLVGKATVIRRPSIAKLKAIFENQNTVSNEPQISRPISFPVNRNNSINRDVRHCKSLVDNIMVDNVTRNELNTMNSSGPTIVGQETDMRPPQVTNNDNYASNEDQPIYAEYNPSMNKSNNLVNNCQPFELSLNEQKLLHQNHQKLQQEIRQHIQRKQLQSLPPIPPQMSVSGFGNSSDIPKQTLFFHQMAPQISVQMPIASHIQSQALPPPPKPPRTYQYHNLNESPIGSLQNNSEGRLIVSVALPRRPPNEMTVNQSNHYEAINRRRADMTVANMSQMNSVIPETLLVNAGDLANSNMEHFTNNSINTDNAIKVMNVSNNNIYEAVLPKYRSAQPLEAAVANGQSPQNIHSYFEIMKLRNAGLNSTLPFYDALYARNGYMTVPNLRHIPVPTVAQIPCPYIQFKPNFESLYSNTTNINNNNNNNIITNNLNKTRSEQNIRKANEKIANNLVDNLNRNETCKKSNQSKKSANVDKKEPNTAKVSKAKSNKIAGNSSANTQSQSQGSNSGAFTKISNAFRGLRIKSSEKAKVKTNQNNSPLVNNVNVNNGPVISRPPHSHRFSPPTQWTQV